MSTRDRSDLYDPKRVDVDSRDPNIRGIQGSVIHTGNQDDRLGYARSLDEGLTKEDALDRLAKSISMRLANAATRGTDVRI